MTKVVTIKNFTPIYTNIILKIKHQQVIAIPLMYDSQGYQKIPEVLGILERTGIPCYDAHHIADKVMAGVNVYDDLVEIIEKQYMD